MVVSGQLQGDDPKVQEALSKMGDRTKETFKVHHEPTKQKWARGAGKEVENRNLEQIRKEEADYAASAKAASEEEARKNAVIDARLRSAKTDLDAAEKHYSGSVKTPFLNDLELKFCEELALLRSSPSIFAEKLRVLRLDKFEVYNLLFTDPDGFHVTVKTAEGRPAVVMATEVLKVQSPLPELKPSCGLTRAMHEAVVANPEKPNALGLVEKYGKISGTARQIKYRGPFGSAEDAILGILIDDGNRERSRQRTLLDPKFKKFGVCAGTEPDGKHNFIWIVIASEYEEKN